MPHQGCNQVFPGAFSFCFVNIAWWPYAGSPVGDAQCPLGPSGVVRGGSWSLRGMTDRVGSAWPNAYTRRESLALLRGFRGSVGGACDGRDVDRK